MTELTGLSKTILTCLILFFIYKSKIYMKIYELGDNIFKKLGYYNETYHVNKEDKEKRHKYLNKFIPKYNKNDEI